jgi:hypothetical protein
LLALALLAEGCSYHYCKDELKRDYVPQGETTRWTSATTLEVDFGVALRAPDEVDPRRFALVRYNIEAAGESHYGCEFDICYRPLDAAAAIPTSLDWDPDEPSLLRLHFAGSPPSDACEPWRGHRAHYQALELIYLARDPQADYAYEDMYVAAPDQLARADGWEIDNHGPVLALRWLRDCRAGESCELEPFCIERGGLDYTPYYLSYTASLWVDCP